MSVTTNERKIGTARFDTHAKNLLLTSAAAQSPLRLVKNFINNLRKIFLANRAAIRAIAMLATYAITGARLLSPQDCSHEEINEYI